MLLPQPLHPGDTIAIISPASTVNPDYIDQAALFFKSEGFNVRIMPHAKGPADGSYASSDMHRLADITDAYSNPEIKAILCSRGGYGTNHLLPLIPESLIAENPKWLIGFSDISALHALSLHAGVISLHAPMAKHLSTLPPDHYCTRAMMRILTESLPVEYIIPSHLLNHYGEAEGIIVGGNLAVINGLAETPFDPMATKGSIILFIEDISEAIYAVERMLIRLYLSGKLQTVKGLLIGQFTEYRPDKNHPDMYTMMASLFDRIRLPSSIPIAYNFPAGHTDDNLPIPLGATARLSVTPSETILTLLPPGLLL